MKDKILSFISDEMDTDIKNVLVDLYFDKIKETEAINDKKVESLSYGEVINDTIEEVLNYVGIDIDKLDDFDIDGKNSNDDYYQDLKNEWADNKISIYNHDLWREAPFLSDFIDEALNEYGVNIVKDGLMRLFQCGQGLFYERVGGEVLDALQKYKEEQEEEVEN